MPTSNYYIQASDGWVEVESGGASFVRISRQPSSHPLYVAGGASPPTPGANASGTITFTGLPVADETVTVGSDVFTFKAAAVAPFEVTIGADANATATNLAAVITARSSVASATSLAGAVTVTALARGTVGNSIALAEAATNVTVSGANLSGGVNPLIGVGLECGESFFLDVTTTDNFYVRTPSPRPDGPLRIDVYTVP